MKSLLLLCLVGLAVASYPGSGVGLRGLPYREGKQYVFEYSGRLLSGIPELNSLQFSGVGIKCKVHMTVVSGGHGQGPLRFSVRISEAKYVRLNQRHHSESGSSGSGSGSGLGDMDGIPNWRYLPLGEYTPISGDMERFLSNPTRVEMRENGEFEQMVVGGEEPEWSINLKKGLVSLFQTKFSTVGSVNTEVETNSLSGSSGSEPVTDSWVGQEMSLDGTCQVSYQLNELPRYMLKDSSSSVSGNPRSNNWCQGEGQKAFELIKTRDVSSCTKRTSFSFYKPGFYNCGTGNCEGMWSRSSVTRYIACGTSRSDLEIKSIVNEGELSQTLMGYNTEKFLTGTRQNLTLLRTEEVSGGHQSGSISGGEVVLRTLYYEYGTGPHRSSSSSGIQSGVEGVEEINGMPRHTLTTGGKRVTGEKKQELIQQIKIHLKSVINEDLIDPIGLPTKQITMKILTISRGFALLKKSDIESIYSELKGEFSSDEIKKHTFKNLFFETVTIGGTHDCIRFMKEKITAGDLSTIQIMTFFNNLPSYMLSPKQETLEELFRFITTEEKVRNEPIIHHNVILSFSVLVQKACIADNRQTSYPTWVWGSNCSPESRIVVEKWLPYLQTILRESGRKGLKNAIIVSLGHMTHKNVIPMLLPFVESGTPSGISGSGSESGPEEESWNRLPRLLATYSLTSAGKKYPELVIPVLMSIFGNQGENTEIRTAALNVLLKLNPPMWVIQNIATSTWYEKDTQVLKAVNTALFTISTSPEVGDMSGTYVSLQKKAWLVYPMIKRTGGRIPSTTLFFGSDELRRLGVGYQYMTTWVASKDSFWPQSYYVKLVYFLERYQINPLEIGLRINNGKSLISQLTKLISNEGGLSSGPSGEELDEKIKGEVHREWRQVIDKLNIKTRRSSGKADASLYMNVFEDSPVFLNWQSVGIEDLKSKLTGLLGSSGIKSGLKERICGEKQVNWQKMMDLTPTEVTIPSDMGLPIVLELHMPTLISNRGTFNSDCSTEYPKVTAKMHIIFASQLTGWVGTICPFTKEIVVTGVDEHVIINLPLEMGVKIDVEQQKVRAWMKPLQHHRLSGPMDIVHFHIRPYTVAQNWWSLTPMTISRGVQFINANGVHGQKSKSFNFGNLFGVSLKTVVTSETPFLDFRSVWEKVKMLHYNPMNLLRFGWTNTGLRESGLPSLRRHEVQLRYDPSQSTTNELDFSMELNFLSKNKDNVGSPIKMHKVKVEEREGKVLPYKIETTSSSSSSDPKIVKLKEILERTGVEYGTGLGVKLTWVLKSTSGRPRTFSYSANIVGGRQGSYKSKWNGHFECHTSGKKVCLNGDVTWNGLPLWNIEELRNSNNEFRFNNEIGFGQSCTDHKIEASGTTKTSERQKEFSRNSREAVALRKMIEAGQPIAKLSDIAEVVRMQATTLDEVDFKVKYENAPFWVKQGSEYLIQGVKAWLWPYSSTYIPGSSGSGSESGSGSGSGSGFGSGNTWTNMWTVRFEPKTRSFTLTLNRPGMDGITRFEHIRMPYPTEFFLPMNGIKSPLKVVAKKVLGAPIHPVCSLEKEWSKTYDNRTVKTVIDDCYHLLSADCSVEKTFAVLVKNLEGKSNPSGPKKIKAFVGKSTEVVLKPSSSHSRYMASIEVLVNGTRLSISRGGAGKSIVDVKGQIIGSVEEKRDGAVILRTPEVSIAFDGFKARVEASIGLKNKLCGLCGDANGQKIADVRGPQKCVYSKPELISASYRVGSLGGSSCSPLPGHIEQGLREEKSRCLKYSEIPTKVSKSFLAKSGACTQHRHELIEEPSRICFSRRPVIACGDSCTPSGSLVPKTVSFGCMPKNRLGQRYTEEVRQGKILGELGHISESFSIEMPLPASCKPINPRV